MVHKLHLNKTVKKIRKLGLLQLHCFSFRVFTFQSLCILCFMQTSQGLHQQRLVCMRMHSHTETQTYTQAHTHLHTHTSPLITGTTLALRIGHCGRGGTERAQDYNKSVSTLLSSFIFPGAGGGVWRRRNEDKVLLWTSHSLHVGDSDFTSAASTHTGPRSERNNEV